jgi:hypothetical protein
LGNRHGVYIQNAPANVIGGTTPGAANVIAYSAQRGITVWGNAAVRNSLRGNSIFGNGQLGIDLVAAGELPGSVTPNDSLDPDAGPNGLQNTPVITSVTVVPGSITVAGVLRSVPAETFVIDFYSTAAPDPSGFGEGEVYLGSTTVTTSFLGGTRTFRVTLPVAGDLAGQFVTATASRIYPGALETGEFSATVQAEAP